MPLNVYYDEFQPSWEEEGLFARDINGQLIRVVEASEQDYFRQVTVTIDGQPIRVPRAVPTSRGRSRTTASGSHEVRT